MNKSVYSMHLNMKTYFIKDEFNKNRGFKIEDVNISKGYYFYREEDNCIKKVLQHSDIKTEKGEEILFRIRKNKNQVFSIENPLNKQMEKTLKSVRNLGRKLWYVLKSTPDSPRHNKCHNKDEYMLNKKEMIRCGCTLYEVIEKNIKDSNENENCEENRRNHYNISNNNKKSQSIFKITEIKEKDVDYSNKTENEICRICFDGSSSRENPKLHLCSCKDFIHYECLKHWIRTKIKKHKNSQKTVLTYFIKKFCCEVCMKPYPLKFKISGLEKEYLLIDLNFPYEENFIALESLNILKGDNEKKIHIIKLIDSIITYGRRNYCDIIEKNPFVSRVHAFIKYNNRTGEVILENKSEKLDTLVLVKNPINIKENEIDFQVGRTIITANLNKISEEENKNIKF